jgi:hypothetical protein
MGVFNALMDFASANKATGGALSGVGGGGIIPASFGGQPGGGLGEGGGFGGWRGGGVGIGGGGMPNVGARKAEPGLAGKQGELAQESYNFWRAQGLSGEAGARFCR